MRRQKRRRQIDEPEQKNKWLLSFSDTMSLLLVFFIMLFSMSNIDEVKYEDLIDSFKSTSVFESGASLIDMHPIAYILREENSKLNGEVEKLNKIAKLLQEYIEKNNLEDSIFVKVTPKGVEITFQNASLFDSGSASLTSESKRILQDLTPFFIGTSNQVVIEGHTDDRPVAVNTFRDNFELSSERSLSVLYYLKHSGIEPRRLSSAGYGEFRPIGNNSTKEGRAQNRRVTLTILRNDLPTMINN